MSRSGHDALVISFHYPIPLTTLDMTTGSHHLLLSEDDFVVGATMRNDDLPFAINEHRIYVIADLYFKRNVTYDIGNECVIDGIICSNACISNTCSFAYPRPEDFFMSENIQLPARGSIARASFLPMRNILFKKEGNVDYCFAGEYNIPENEANLNYFRFHDDILSDRDGEKNSDQENQSQSKRSCGEEEDSSDDAAIEGMWKQCALIC
jgi:hypothetical protein